MNKLMIKGVQIEIKFQVRVRVGKNLFKPPLIEGIKPADAISCV